MKEIKVRVSDFVRVFVSYMFYGLLPNCLA